MNDFERIDRGKRASDELKLVDHAVESIIGTCMARARDVVSKEGVRATDKLASLCVAMNAAEGVRDYLKAIVDDGEMAHKDLARVRKLEGMSTEQKRWADLLGPETV